MSGSLRRRLNAVGECVRGRGAGVGRVGVVGWSERVESQVSGERESMPRGKASKWSFPDCKSREVEVRNCPNFNSKSISTRWPRAAPWTPPLTSSSSPTPSYKPTPTANLSSCSRTAVRKKTHRTHLSTTHKSRARLGCSTRVSSLLQQGRRAAFDPLLHREQRGAH